MCACERMMGEIVCQKVMNFRNVQIQPRGVEGNVPNRRSRSVQIRIKLAVRKGTDVLLDEMLVRTHCDTSFRMHRQRIESRPVSLQRFLHVAFRVHDVDLSFASAAHDVGTVAIVQHVAEPVRMTNFPIQRHRPRSMDAVRK